jgi:hypothetical protein
MDKKHKYVFHQWPFVGILSIFIGLFNIIIVIIGAFQTPPGHIYLAVGHYFADYFIYTQQIAQGIFGHWLVRNQFTTNDPVQTLIGWGQYLMIGRIASVFRLSPFTAYWCAVFLLTLTLCVLMFVIIKRILSDQPFFIRISAFLFSIFAVPFVTVTILENHVFITPFSFFYAPITMFQRLGGVPHHLSTTICIIGALLLAADCISCADKKQWKKMSIDGILLTVLLLLCLTFAPLQIITAMSSIGITGLW